jgi:protein-tyrosine phosphatase
MWTKLHWLEGPWSGRVALAARPRGGDWLEDEIASWRKAGIDTVLSLLPADEEKELDLQDEARQVKELGMNFRSFPIPDRDVPRSETKLAVPLEDLDADLSAGKNAVIHCRQGIGRTGLVAACLLVTKGLSSGAAVSSVSAARGGRFRKPKNSGAGSTITPQPWQAPIEALGKALTGEQPAHPKTTNEQRQTAYTI